MRATAITLTAALIGAVVSCKGSGDSESKPPSGPAERVPEKAAPAPAVSNDLFDLQLDTFFKDYQQHNPHGAAGLGFHQYDGQLPDYSREAIAGYVIWLKEQRQTFQALAGKIAPEREVERQVVLAEVAAGLFDLEVTEQPFRNPMFYAWPVGLNGYVSRDYAPIDQRAKGLMAICNGAPRYFEIAMDNLAEAIPRTWIATALIQTRGAIQFAKSDVPEALKGISPELQPQLDKALAAYVAALTGYEKFLLARQKQATDDYALGAEIFRRMLREKEGIDIELSVLAEIGEADLARNLAALERAAEAIDAKATVAAVVDRVSADRPAPDKVLAEATEQAAQMRTFLVEEKIVSIPTDDVAEVRETPPFMRWNFAFMRSPGPFEKKQLPSFYYISPPDPKWPAKKRTEYIASRADLLFTTIHEVWPGHFLHGLHKKKNRSKILRSFCSYSMNEGWAHYTEEMMWDAGVGGGDPMIQIGQLQNALLRNVRFVSAIGLHTGGMTVAESKKLFVDKGLQDEASAEQQAVRGTFDPGYLNYTLGKLMIRKLHDDWKVAQGDDYSLQGFHDAFLSYGCAPVPVIRRAMLGKDAGSAL